MKRTARILWLHLVVTPLERLHHRLTEAATRKDNRHG